MLCLRVAICATLTGFEPVLRHFATLREFDVILRDHRILEGKYVIFALLPDSRTNYAVRVSECVRTLLWLRVDRSGNAGKRRLKIAPVT